MTRRPTSLAAGAALAFLVPLLLAAALLLGLLVQRNDAAIRQLEMRSLQQRAELIARNLQHQPGEGWRVALPPSAAAAFSTLYGRAAYAVVDAGGVMVAGGNAAAPLLQPADHAQRQVFSLMREGKDWRGLAVPVTVAGATLSVQVAEDLLHPDVLLDDAAAGFLKQVAWVVLPVFAALGAAALWMLRLVNRPLRHLAGEVARISAATPGERLSETDVPVELLPMVRGINTTLSRIQAAQAEQQAFIADAAHELRTPLAVLQAHMDLMRDRQAAAALGQDLAVLERMVSQLLTIAALDTASLRPDTVLDLRLLASDLAGMLAPLAASHRVTLETQLAPDPVPVLAEEEALSQAIVNLLENAIGHAPEGSAVRLAVTAEGRLSVTDAGPGVPEHARKLVFRRFWRARRRREAGRRGAGLGLSIVRRAAEIHGGAVSVEDAPGGGACFTLSLPLHGGAFVRKPTPRLRIGAPIDRFR